jgi:hypothetical protein
MSGIDYGAKDAPEVDYDALAAKYGATDAKPKVSTTFYEKPRPVRETDPVKTFGADLLTGASSLMRGGLNLLPGNMGTSIFPPAEGSEGTAGRLIGSMLDPVALGIGGTVAKALPYQKVMGNGMLSGAKALASNFGSGSVTGSAIGALSEDSNATTGGLVGGAANVILPPLMSGVGKLAGKVTDVVTGRGSKVTAGNILRSAAGDDLQAFRAALAAAPDDITAGQAAEVAGVSKNTWRALQKLAEANDKDDFFSKLAATQRKDMLDALGKIAGGDTQTTAKLTVGQAKKSLNAATTPLREVALDAANATPGIDTSRVLASLQAKANAPSVAGNSVAKGILGRVSEAIQDEVEKGGGVINAEALYAIRKNAVNSEVERLLGTADPKVKARYAAKLLSDVKQPIDEAIINAGGTGWKDYLKTYEQGMTGINQQKMGAKALDLFQRTPAKFESLVAGNEPKMVEKIFGTEYDLAKAMGSKVLPMNEVAANIARDKAIKDGATLGEKPLAGILADNQSKFKLPNWINHKIAITNRVLDELETRVNKKTMQAVYAAMRNGKSANALLDEIPSSEKIAVINALVKGRGAGELTGGITSATLPSDTQQ